MKKQKTNRQVLNQAIKELDDMDIVILRERILAVCEQVIENKEEITESMKYGFMSPRLFIGACERIFKKVDFEQQAYKILKHIFNHKKKDNLT